MAIILSVFILISICPISIFAAGEEYTDIQFSSNNNERDPDAVTINEKYNLNAVREIISRREENVKHFILPDGSVEAIVYSNSVHRKDENGIWQDIDNRLDEDKNKNNQGYITSDGRTIFTKKLNTDNPKIFEINENGYQIKVSFNNEDFKNTNAKLSNHAEKYIPSSEDSLEEQYKKLKEINNTTTLLYKNILKGIDFEYKIYANDIKENIIINKTSDEYKYSFVYHLSGLCPTLNSDGSISLKDIATGDRKYNMSAPFMYDAKGNISNSVYYTLDKLAEGVYEITLVADTKWINDNERTLPVVIDPLVESTRLVFDTYVSTLNKDSNFGSSTVVQVAPQCTSFFRSNMPTLPSGAVVQSATWYGAIYHMEGVELKTIIEARTMEETWSEYSDTYNTLYNKYGSDLGVSTNVLDSKTITSNSSYSASNPRWISFDVTSAVQSWYSGTKNNGIAIYHNHTYLYEFEGYNYYTAFISWDARSSYTSYYRIKYSESKLMDGVYRIKNTHGLYMTVDGSGVESGANLVQDVDSTSGGTTDPSYNQLFKIAYLGTYGLDQSNFYSIRPLTNCELGVYAVTNMASNPKVVTANASTLPITQSWIISENGGKYTIRNGYASNSGYYLAAPSTSDSDIVLFTNKFILGDTVSDNCKWTFEKYDEDIDEVGMISIPPTIKRGETIDYDGYMRSSQIGVNGPVTYLVANDDFTDTDKATIDASTGVLIALKTGRIKVGLTYESAPYSWWWNVDIEASFVDDLLDHPSQLVNISDISYTNDGFYMLTTPLSSILNKAGINYLYEDLSTNESTNVLAYYDDWYLYAIETTTDYKYGLIKMREQEHDGVDGDDPGVTVSFIEFNYIQFLATILYPTVTNTSNLLSSLDLTTGPNSAVHSDVLIDYFSQTESQASYLIADRYVKLIAQMCCVSNVIRVPEKYVDIENLYVSTLTVVNGRLPNAIEANNEKAGYEVVYGLNTNGDILGYKDVFYINISDPNDLTIYEKYAILMTHTGNVTFNSFAAEVECHADAILGWYADIAYSKAIRADMCIDEVYGVGTLMGYHVLDSDVVTNQKNVHGEK